MNKLVLCFLFLATTLVASSQKVYFVYLQSEAEQPFFVKMNEKISSSTASGYLILSKLRDSTYNFNIGFPQNKWPEQTFSVPIQTKDRGYLLKNFGDKGWGLFDLQTLAVIMPTSGKPAEAVAKTDPKDVSAFTEILSKAADDPSLKDKPVAVKVEEKKIEPKPQEVVKMEEPKAQVKETVTITPIEAVEQPVVKKDEPKKEVKETIVPPVEKPIIKTEEQKAPVKTPDAVKPEIIEQPVVKKEEPKTEVKETIVAPVEKPIIKTEEQKAPVKTPDAVKPEINEQPVVKKDEPKEEVKETVTAKPVEVIEQPLQSTEPVEYKKSIVTKRSESSTTEGFGLVFLDDNHTGVKDTIRLLIPNPKPTVAVIKEQPKEEKKFLDITTEPAKTDVTITPTVVKEEIKETVKPTPTSNCAATATDADFLKLRKNMAASESDDEMVMIAGKDFKTKCYTVQQLKNLSTLFLNDAGKYKFFDAAYLSASDAESFTTLQAELKDEYYINRFKAMLRN